MSFCISASNELTSFRVMEFRVHYAQYPLCGVLLIRLIKIDADSFAVWRFEVSVWAAHSRRIQSGS